MPNVKCRCGMPAADRRLDAVPVSHGFGVRWGAGTVRPYPLEDPPEVAVADCLAMLAERDHGVVDVLDLDGRQREPERVAPLLHGVASGVAAEHQPRRRLPDVLRPHDLVGGRVLEDAVL